MKIINHRKLGGFSLTEMLVVISIIGVISSVAVPNISGFMDTAEREKSRRNGQVFVEQYRAAKAAGAPFTGNTKETILNELITGVTGELVPTFFILSLADSEKSGALAYCSYDASTETMKFHPKGGQGGGTNGQSSSHAFMASSSDEVSMLMETFFENNMVPYEERSAYSFSWDDATVPFEVTYDYDPSSLEN